MLKWEPLTFRYGRILFYLDKASMMITIAYLSNTKFDPWNLKFFFGFLCPQGKKSDGVSWWTLKTSQMLARIPFAPFSHCLKAFTNIHKISCFFCSFLWRFFVVRMTRLEYSQTHKNCPLFCRLESLNLDIWQNLNGSRLNELVKKADYTPKMLTKFSQSHKTSQKIFLTVCYSLYSYARWKWHP